MSTDDSDRELLELAAKALGYEFRYVDDLEPHIKSQNGGTEYWNPLDDDGEALRLVAKLQMLIDYSARGHRSTGEVVVTCGPNICITEPKQGDVSASTRRAVTRAAAEIGKQHSCAKSIDSSQSQQ